MTDFATYALHKNVALVTLNNPPINSLGLGLRTGIVAAIDRAMTDKAVHAVVITGSARTFSGGADVTGFGTPKSSQEPSRTP